MDDRYDRRSKFGHNNNRPRFTPPVRVDEEIDVLIEAVGEKGDGIAKKNGFVLFVPNTKEGQSVRVKVTRVLNKVGFAEAIGEAKTQVQPQVKHEQEHREEKPQEAEETYEPSEDDSEDFGEESEDTKEDFEEESENTNDSEDFEDEREEDEEDFEEDEEKN